MKKLLALLGAASAVAAPATAVISCVQPQTDNNTNNGGDTDTDGNNNGGGDENTEEVKPTTPEELEKNPFDLNKLTNYEALHVESKDLVGKTEEKILDAINNAISESNVQLVLENLTFQYNRSFTKIEGEVGGVEILSVDGEDPNAPLIASDVIKVSPNTNYLTNSIEIIVQGFNLENSIYHPGLTDVAQFIMDIEQSYYKIFKFQPDFYKRVDLYYFENEDADGIEITKDNAGQYDFTNESYITAEAKKDEILFVNKGIFKYDPNATSNQE